MFSPTTGSVASMTGLDFSVSMTSPSSDANPPGTSPCPVSPASTHRSGWRHRRSRVLLGAGWSGLECVAECAKDAGERGPVLGGQPTEQVARIGGPGLVDLGADP